MFGNNPYMQPQAYQSPYEQRLNAMQNYGQQQQSQSQQVIQVNGQNGANAYPLAPNSSVLLLDNTQAIIWLKQTDGAGYPTLTPYKITPYQAAAPVDMSNIEQRLTAIENRLGVTQNEQSDSQPINKSGTGADVGTK